MLILMLKRHSETHFSFMNKSNPIEGRKLLTNVRVDVFFFNRIIWKLLCLQAEPEGEGLLLNNCLPLDFQKPGKVFLMPCTDVCKGITHTHSFWCSRAQGLLCAEDKQSRQSAPWRSYQMRACWSWWNSQPSCSRLVVLLSSEWLSWVHECPVLEECSPAAMALVLGQSWQEEQERGTAPEWPQKEDGISVLQWSWRDILGLVSSVSERLRFGWESWWISEKELLKTLRTRDGTRWGEGDENGKGGCYRGEENVDISQMWFGQTDNW